MDYLIISPAGLSLFAVPHLAKAKEVGKIYFCTTDPSMKHVGTNMETISGYEKMERIYEPFKILNTASKENLIVFIDDTQIGYLADHLRKEGWKVIGGSSFMDKFEDDRTFATDVMSRIMKVPESTTFDSFEAVINFLKTKEKDEKYVFKPHDGLVPKEYTYVGKNIPEMIEAIKTFKAEWKWETNFQLQKFVKGAEVDFSGYFNGKEFITNSMIIYFENKPFMDYDIGPATGGSVAVEFAHKPEGIFWETLQKTKPILQKAGYIGQLAVNCIVSEEDKDLYFLEVCSRVGYPSFPIDITLLEENKKTLHDLFLALANGVDNPKLFPTDKASVTLSVYTSSTDSNARDNKDLPISWDSKYDDYFYPYYVMGNGKGKMVIAGIAKDALNVTCADATIDGAVQMLYENYMPSLRLKGKMYRSDLGKSAKERLKKLREWKLL